MAVLASQRSLTLLRSLRLSRANPSACGFSPQRKFSASPVAPAFVNSSARSANAAASNTTASSTTAAKPSTTPQRTIRPPFIPTGTPSPPTARNVLSEAESRAAQSQRSLTDGLSDMPPILPDTPHVDWTRSYHGLGSAAFTPEQQDILTAPIELDDVEVKPDGILYLPEIKYRRILNKAFGAGGWGLAPRGESIVTERLVTREYALVAQGRLVSIARGEQQYFDPEGIPTATEGCKSNALMRCCKDIGIASELWDPRFIRKFANDYTKEVWVEHVSTKKKKKIALRKDDSVRYPWKEPARV